VNRGSQGRSCHCERGAAERDNLIAVIPAKLVIPAKAGIHFLFCRRGHREILVFLGADTPPPMPAQGQAAQAQVSQILHRRATTNHELKTIFAFF